MPQSSARYGANQGLPVFRVLLTWCIFIHTSASRRLRRSIWSARYADAIVRLGNNFGMIALDPMSRHDHWRVLLAREHVTLCGLCDREQKLLYHPECHDGCVCYREYYKQRWPCQRCDVQNSINVGGDIPYFTSRRRKLRQVGDQMRVMPVDQRPANLSRRLS